MYKYNPFIEALVDLARLAGCHKTKLCTHRTELNNGTFDIETDLLELRPYGWQKQIAALALRGSLRHIGDEKVTDRFVWFTEDDVNFDNIRDKERVRGFAHDEMRSDVERQMYYPDMMLRAAEKDIKELGLRSMRKFAEQRRIVKLKHKIEKLLCLRNPLPLRSICRRVPASKQQLA